MANMRYCMFENTNCDFAACVDRLGEVGALSELQLSARESTALERLVRNARTLVFLYEDLQSKEQQEYAE